MDMQYKIKYSAAAIDDLESIRVYYEKTYCAPISGVRKIAKILKAIDTLDTFPDRGMRLEPQLRQLDIRSICVDQYLCFYKIYPKARVVRVINIIYAGKNLDDFQPGANG